VVKAVSDRYPCTIESHLIKLRERVGWAILLAEGIYTLSLLCLSSLAWSYGYRPEAHSPLLFVRYSLPLLIFPCFLLALVRRRWAPAPLWIVSLCVLILPFALDTRSRIFVGYRPNASASMREFAILLLIPLGTQLGLWLKGLSIPSDS
jgi:hypothetical protein